MASKRDEMTGWAVSRRRLLGTAGALAVAGPGRGQASVLNRTARIVIGFPPGGASDVVARLFAERLRGLYAPQVVVENRTGAGGRVAVDAVKAAAPDGTTLLQTPASLMTVFPHVYGSALRYDALTDYLPVTTISSFPFAFAVSASHPAQDLAGFAAWARQREPVAFGSAGAGSIPHFLGLQIGRALGIQVTHAPYRGGGPALQDVMSGGLPAAMAVVGETVELALSGRVRILAVSSAERLERLPNVPCLAELGYPDLTTEEWYGIFLPARTPPAVAEGLHANLTEVVARPDMTAALGRLDFRPLTSSSAEFVARIRSERERWGRVINEFGFRMEDGDLPPPSQPAR